MNQRNKGFTLIELLVVIFILGILAAMLIIGIKGMILQGQVADTRTRLQTLQALEQNLEASNELSNIQAIYGGSASYSNISNAITAPNPNIASFTTIQAMVTDDTGKTKIQAGPQALTYTSGYPSPILNTQQVMIQLLRLSDSNTAYYKYPPSNMAVLLSSASNDPPAIAPGPPILLDTWGYPILFVPGSGILLPNPAGGTFPAMQAPDKKGFWISSGPGGTFSSPYYSFVSQN